MSETGYIYTLTDPRTEEPRYVGATKEPKQRYSNHLSSPTNDDVKEWLDELEDCGLEPNMNLVRVEPMENLSEKEREIISRLAKQWDLLNKSLGGYSPRGETKSERSVEISVYMHPDDAKAVHEAAEQSEYSNTSQYVRSLLPECSNE